jgi:hypothetical protein
MSTTTLPRLLRSALSWHGGRPQVDNRVLEAVAAWLDGEGRREDAEAVRLSLEPDPSLDWEGDGLPADGPAFARCDLGLHHHVEVHAGPDAGGAPSGFASAFCSGSRTDYPLTLRELADPGYASVRRVRDLARWHCVCDMLGWPPLRFACEE